MELGTALSYDDRTSVHLLPVEALHAEVLWIAVSAVP
jgi:hypothetical protein